MPPGPFPPSGTEPDGVVDLGIRLRDGLYRRTVLLDARAALHSNIRMAARSPQQLLIALPAIDAFIDTWPLASMIEDSVESWIEEPDPHSLAVLFRSAEVIGQVLGWPRSVDRRWPLPDEAWMRRQLGGQPAIVVPRGPRDGSAAAAVALNANFVSAEPMALPNILTVHGDALATGLEDAQRALRDGSARAVDVDGWIPWDDASQKAFADLTATTDMQSAYARFGVAALVAGAGPAFDELLDEPPTGVWGEKIRRTCDALVVPSLDSEGAMNPVGVLCWDAAYAPIRVNPAAISVLEALDDADTVEGVARALKADEAAVESVLRQLTELGAVTAAQG